MTFLFEEIITCGAVLSGFELAEAIRKLGHEARIATKYRNEELEKYFNITPEEPKGTTITFTPKLKGDWAYVRTKDPRWLTHTEPKICASQWLADWIGGEVIGNGTHERFYNMNLERDIDVLIEGNDETNKNIEETIKEAKKIGKKIVWFGRQTKEIDGVVNISSPPLEKIPLLYNRAKVFLKMSKEEGWGRPVAEAKACGCEVINLSGGNQDIEIVSWESIALKIIKCAQSHSSETI
jgi:hypothetical protein